MKIDLIQRLRDYINTLNLNCTCKLGTLEETGSLVLYALPGGKTIAEYMDGVKDQELIFEIGYKTKNNLESYATLTQIGTELESLEYLPSLNNSYTFNGIKVASAPSPTNVDAQGYFVYRLSFRTLITV